MALSEILVIVLVLGLAVWPATLSLRPGILLSALLILSLVPYKNPDSSNGRLSYNQALYLISLLVLLGSLGTEPLHCLYGLILLLPGAGLAILGVMRTIKDVRAKRRWSSFRYDMVYSAVATLAASALVVGVSWIALNFRSELPITPGKSDFLFIMFFWAGTWFGLDGYLRELGSHPITSYKKWFIERRHSLMLIAVCATLIILRESNL